MPMMTIGLVTTDLNAGHQENVKAKGPVQMDQSSHLSLLFRFTD
jgi:hypothetical protein